MNSFRPESAANEGEEGKGEGGMYGGGGGGSWELTL